MIKRKLNEAEVKTAETAVAAADANRRITVNSKNVSLFDILDELLERNLETFYTNMELIKEGEMPDKNFVNLLIIGMGGTGKTSMIEQWAHENNLNLVTKSASIMDDADLNGIPVAALGDKSSSRLPTNEFDSLDKADSVLFLDEFNRGRASVRGTLLKLIQGHTLPDPSQPGSIKFLPNLLFTIAAINPSDANYNTDPLDDAELSRFIIYVQGGADKKEYLEYITKVINRKIEILKRIGLKDKRIKSTEQAIRAWARRLSLVTALVDDPTFFFDDQADIDAAHNNANDSTLPAMLLSYRTLTQALFASDGTVDSFLYYYKKGANRDKYELVRTILSKYKEKDDVANAALDKYRQPELDHVFKSEREVRQDKIDAMLNRIGSKE